VKRPTMYSGLSPRSGPASVILRGTFAALNWWLWSEIDAPPALGTGGFRWKYPVTAPWSHRPSRFWNGVARS
jgi:hypothetical protein